MIYDRYQWKQYKYILVIIDIHSRYAEARAMTNRENTTIMENIKSIIKIMGKPKIISGDNEFNTIEFKKYCLENDIGAKFSEPLEIQKNSIVERFNKTLALNLKRIRLSTKNYDWPSYLKKVVDNYNNTYHETTKHSPDDIFNKGMFNEQTVIRVIPNLNVGDNVRISVVKGKLGIRLIGKRL
jgi:transposase InsO family protein